MTTVKLYLGAHKTATTHLQGVLIANRARLKVEGITLSAPQDIRKEWLPKFFRAQQALVQEGEIPDDLRQSLRSERPEHGDWILTEENIIGIPLELAKMPGIYPMAERRLSTLKALFEDSRLEFYFSIRSYDSFYRSMYSEVVRNRGFMPFAEFFDEARFKNNSWVSFVEQVASILPQENITLWKFEDFRSVMPDVLKRLAGVEDVSALIENYAPETTRPSLSQKTVDILSDLAPAVGAAEALRLTETVNSHYAVSEGHAALEVMPEAARDNLRKRYEDDISQIKSKFPRVNILSPIDR